MKYAYRTRSQNRRIHLLTDYGQARCDANIFDLAHPRSKYTATNEIPKGARICCNCEKMGMVGPQLSKPQRKHLAKSAKRVSLDFYASWEWKKLRFEVLKAYGAVCMLCNSTDHIVVDHIKPRSKYPHLQLVFENMQVLCDACNKGKSNDDETDFRPKCPEPELTGDELSHMRSILN
jgi:5-methylcytosine-specific restriction endonuclease McrA